MSDPSTARRITAPGAAGETPAPEGEVPPGQGERVWNQWAPTDEEAVIAREAAEARAAEGTQTLPAYPEAEDEVLSVDEAREEAKAEREAAKTQAEAQREQRKAEQHAEVEQRKEAKKTQK